MRIRTSSGRHRISAGCADRVLGGVFLLYDSRSMVSAMARRFWGSIAFWVFVAAALPAWSGQISCQKSGIDFDRAIMPAGYDVICKREETGPSTATGDELMVERAFSPMDSSVGTILVSSNDGKYGNASLIAAHDGTTLSDPNMRTAIESKVRLFGDNTGSIGWESSKHIDGYDVEFFRLALRATGSGGTRECMGFVRYLDGTAASHERRVIGTYCEFGASPFNEAKAERILSGVVVRPQ